MVAPLEKLHRFGRCRRGRLRPEHRVADADRRAEESEETVLLRRVASLVDPLLDRPYEARSVVGHAFIMG